MRTIDERIDRLFRRDRLLALGFTVAMWMVLVLVYLRALEAVGSPDIAVVLGVAMVLLGGLNTASTLALVRRYALAKDAVYRPDVELTDQRAAERAGRA